MNRAVFIGLFALVAVGGQAVATPATDAPVLFVPKTFSWHKAPGGHEVSQGSIIALDAAHNFLELVTQISRGKNDRALTVDLKSGYLISTGTWSRTSDGEITVSSRVVDSYKYFQVGAGKPDAESSRTWTISGEELGPVKRRLTRDGQVFEPSKKFRSGGRVLEFWSQFVLRK